MADYDKDVEKFYTTGSKRLEHTKNGTEHSNEGFISFGYWEPGDDYVSAAKRLLNYFIDNSGIKKADKILNVACGYGAETFAYFEKFKPKEIVGIDITKVHVDYANEKAKKAGLDKKIRFVHGSAVQLSDFKDNYFSHILGIEGPAHFNTREQFFCSANRVLKPGGEMMLTDIIIGPKYKKWNPIQFIMLRACAKGWVMPKQNGISEAQYRKQLQDAGFEIEFFNKIGDKVFPGYAKSFENDPQRHNDKKMGKFNAFMFRFIGKFLGYLSKKGLIEYIYFKARKK